MATYTSVYVYKKEGNLVEYFKGKTMIPNGNKPSGYMLKERNIQLNAHVRYENKVDEWGRKANGIRTFCRIECPINPLPIKGEFEIPSLSALDAFLRNNGWSRCCHLSVK